MDAHEAPPSSTNKRRLPTWANQPHCVHQARPRNRPSQNQPPRSNPLLLRLLSRRQTKKQHQLPLSTERTTTSEQVDSPLIKGDDDQDRKTSPFLNPDTNDDDERHFRSPSSSRIFNTAKSSEQTNSKSELVPLIMQHQYTDAAQTSQLRETIKSNKRILPASLLNSIPTKSGPTLEQSSPHTSWDMLKMLDSSVYKEESSPPEGLMSISLLKHQRIALAWMERMENDVELNGGILADDQGLGKTIETMALILKHKPVNCKGQKQTQSELLSGTNICHGENFVDNLMGGTLIVCPTSVLKQWEQEIEGKITRVAGLSVLVYHGSNRIKDSLELGKHDVVLTTYAVVATEAPKQLFCGDNSENPKRNGRIATLRKVTIKRRSKGISSVHVPSRFRNRNSGPLYRVFWFRLVLDEAQNIKNPRARIANVCWMLKAKKKWCLSGTPIQNMVDDLYSYFRFLNYVPYSDYSVFQSKIKNPLAENPSIGFRKLQHILQKIMLRRTKETLVDGMPILNLPKKILRLTQIDFSPAEREVYTELEAKYRKKFQMYAATGSVQRNYVNILSMLLRLRQACDHPSLVKDHLKAGEQLTQIEVLSREKQHFLITRLNRNSDMCSICMDIPEDAVITKCAHIFCRQCISQELEHYDYIFCPNTNCDDILQLHSIYSRSSLTSTQEYFDAGVTLPMSSLVQTDTSSSKINAVIETILALPMVTNVGQDQFSRQNYTSLCRQKALVFSQWTRMLDLLEISLSREKICYRRLDGTMSTQAREHALSEFKTQPEVSIMLLSLKAASLGLNMVEASHVLLVDVWWNPTTEQQAIDRAHRIGQKNEVIVSQFTVRNTIEDRMLALQEQKRQIVASAFGEDGQANRVQLTETDMNYLFHV